MGDCFRNLAPSELVSGGSPDAASIRPLKLKNAIGGRVRIPGRDPVLGGDEFTSSPAWQGGRLPAMRLSQSARPEPAAVIAGLRAQ